VIGARRLAPRASESQGWMVGAACCVAPSLKPAKAKAPLDDS